MRIIAIWLVCLLASNVSAQEAVVDNNMSEIVVIGTTPLLSAGVPIEKYAGNVQTIDGDDITNANYLDIADILLASGTSMSVNSAQNNSYQDDIFYRGFLASPLVGAAIGLSIYLDGVRVNEGFGNSLNWDLIPEGAISKISIIPGSNPLYGLNTLGGALALETKSGHSFAGTALEASGGYFGRYNFAIEHGGTQDNFDWYVAANYGEEDGWRTLSPSDVKQIFAKVGWENADTRVALSSIIGNTDLIGNGFSPDRLLQLDRTASHTWPDQTQNRLYHFNLQVSHDINNTWQVAGNLFHRGYKRNTLNGDAETGCGAERAGNDIDIFIDDEAAEEVPANRCNDAADPTGFFDENGNPLLAMDELKLQAGGEERRTSTITDTFGGTIQTTLLGDLFTRTSQLSLGIDFSRSDTTFVQSEAEAELVRRGNIMFTTNAEEQAVEVNVATEQTNFGVFATDTIDVTDTLALTVSGRWQHANIIIRDLTGEEENQDLNGEHNFNRFNPAAGISYRWRPNLTAYVSYAEGFRVPTAAELSCADEDDPCNLPNAFVADPPLLPVIASTIEVGTRGTLQFDNIKWHLNYFRTTLKNDLLFTVTETGGGGFFQNIDKTMRQGIEAGLIGRRQDVFNYFLNYSFVKATFEDDITLASVINVAGEQVQAGNSIPGIPEHTLKLGAEYQLFNDFWLGGNMQASNGNYLRGDESNSQPKTSSYAIFNINARYQFPRFEIWGRIDNVLNKDYETAATRNFNANAGPIFGDDEIMIERFSAPGAPFAVFVGIKFHF